MLIPLDVTVKHLEWFEAIIDNNLRFVSWIFYYYLFINRCIKMKIDTQVIESV